ncbi:MAG: hypothetical protein U1A27_00070 [Phycisphaerae bacterium]
MLLRNLSQWAALPIEMVAQLPPEALERLGEAIVARDPFIVQDRKSE